MAPTDGDVQYVEDGSNQQVGREQSGENPEREPQFSIAHCEPPHMTLPGTRPAAILFRIPGRVDEQGVKLNVTTRLQ